MIKRLLLTILLGSGLGTAALAQERFEVSEVEISGLKRIGASTVLGQIGFERGDIIDARIMSQAIGRLYATGLFRDVEVGRSGTTVSIAVTENPTIRTIRFEGMSELDEEKVLELLAGRDIAPGRIFKRGDAEFISEGIETFYEQINYFLTAAQTVTVPLEDNTVDLVVQVTESEKTKVVAIRFHGNVAYAESELLDVLELRTSSLFSGFFDRDAFSDVEFEADLERLRSFYTNAGFIRFEVLSTDISIASGGIEIDIFLAEGARYSFAQPEVTAPAAIVDLDEAIALAPFSAGEVFSDQLVENYRASLLSILRDDGYAFAQVEAQTLIDDANLAVVVDVAIDPGQKVIVREINFIGNNITADEVLRMQMEILEGEQFSQDKLEYSLTRLRRTSYILAAQATEIQVAPDLVDLEVEVTETNRGTFLIGFGYSSTEKLSFRVSFQRNNILGTGNDFSINAENSSSKRSLDFDLHQANITDSGISRNFKVYYLDDRPDTTTASSNSFDRIGGRVAYNIPLNREWSWNAGLDANRTKINNATAITTVGPPPAGVTDEAVPFIQEYGDSQFNFTSLIGLRYDTRDSANATSRGILAELNLDLALPPGEVSYYKINGTASYFQAISQDKRTVLNVRGRVGITDSIGSDIHPFYERYAIGSGNLRSFKLSSIVIRDRAGKSIGGRVLATGSVETERTLDLFDGQSVRAGLFLDVANLWPELGETAPGHGLRASAGVQFKIRTPVFPLSFTYGIPLKKQPGDVTENFQFRIGL